MVLSFALLNECIEIQSLSSDAQSKWTFLFCCITSPERPCAQCIVQLQADGSLLVTEDSGCAVGRHVGHATDGSIVVKKPLDEKQKAAARQFITRQGSKSAVNTISFFFFFFFFSLVHGSDCLVISTTGT
jgi:hypothetical protein